MPGWHVAMGRVLQRLFIFYPKYLQHLDGMDHGRQHSLSKFVDDNNIGRVAGTKNGRLIPDTLDWTWGWRQQKPWEAQEVQLLHHGLTSHVSQYRLGRKLVVYLTWQLIRQATALAYSRLFEHNQRKLFHYPHLDGADEATSTPFDCALTPSLTDLRKKEVIRVWCRTIKLFRNLEHMSFVKSLKEVCSL